MKRLDLFIDALAQGFGWVFGIVLGLILLAKLGALPVLPG